MDAEDVIERFGMVPHPEGGHYVERWRDQPASEGGRGTCSTILFLLRRGERSHWHRVDADELWYFHAGDPLRLHRSPDDRTPPTVATLGLGSGEEPDLLVPSGWWQAAEPVGAWTLVSCAVAPAFDFDGFELAPAEFVPGA